MYLALFGFTNSYSIGFSESLFYCQNIRFKLHSKTITFHITSSLTSFLLLVIEPQLAMPSRTMFLAKPIEREWSLKESPTSFMHPLLVPPVTTRAFVVEATCTKLLPNASLTRSLIFKSAPPVTEIISPG